MSGHRASCLVAGIGLSAVLAAPMAMGQPTHGEDPPAARGADTQTIERGRYLVAAGDCVACHTQAGGASFTGGRPVQTPFGVVLSANLTPDEATGIGRYDAAAFYRALREGIDREGRHLYPAFPYPYYTRVTREDSDAMFAYLRTLAPVDHPLERNQLPFPFNLRPLMAVWNLLFLDKGPRQPDPARSAAWNRGAYLVEGLAHCEACHTPRNALGGPKDGQAFQGGRFAQWFAPDITPNRHTGIGSWSHEDLVEFLRAGRNAHSGASGEMGEVVAFSTAQMNDADLAAIASYVQGLAPSPDRPAPEPGTAQMQQGEAIWRDACAACHREDAAGVAGALPPLRGNANLQQHDPTTVLRTILVGARHRPTQAAPTPFTMPPFGWKLDDAEVAAVATYARNSWGNHAPAVEPGTVGKLRAELARAPDRQHLAAAAEPKQDMAHPGPGTLSAAGTDSRDNGTPQAGRPAP